MECYCEPASDDGANSSVWEVRWRRARIEHRCCECHELVRPGELYENIFSVCDGSPMTFKTCKFCAEEYQRLLAKHPDVMWHKGNEDLACLLVWDIRNEADRRDA